VAICEDERNGNWWMGLSHGHWGQKLHFSKDKGANWIEVATPKYPEGSEIKPDKPAKLNLMWAMQGGGNDKADTLFVGTEPGGLFRSNDYGESWNLCESLWNDPDRQEHWFGGGFDNPAIHSIEVDPRNSDHLYIGISCGGVYESIDGGNHWTVRNSGLVSNFLPDQTARVGHDPHLLKLSPSNPEVLWQQAHCGIWRSSDAARSWNEVTGDNDYANFGFTICIDPKDENRAWVIPAISDEIRVAVEDSLCVSRTDDGGETWTDYRNGLPQETTTDIVYRHAMDRMNETVVFGTTTGNVFYSIDDGENWQVLNNYLPMVNVVKLLEE